MIEETTMEHRRLERLSRLTFFMARAVVVREQDERVSRTSG